MKGRHGLWKFITMNSKMLQTKDIPREPEGSDVRETRIWTELIRAWGD